MINIQNMNELVQQAMERCERVYKELHKWPELGNKEFKTAQVIERELHSLEIKTERLTKTGVVGHLDLGRERTMALRVEMDGLPIAEETDVSYMSRRTGYMHACGHDVHMAVSIGAAHIMRKLGDSMPCNMRFIFQPNEEGGGGADEMIKNGVMENVDYIIGFHVKPEMTSGTIGIKKGLVHGSSVMMELIFSGTASHGACPHMGASAVMAACKFVSEAGSLVKEAIDPMVGWVISFGQIEGGCAPNITANKATVKGIIRGENEKVCRYITAKLQDLGKMTETVLGTEAKMVFKEGYKEVENKEIPDSLLEKAVLLDKASLTVDDFSAYLQESAGLYFYLGCGYENEENAGLHSERFVPDIRCVKNGVDFVMNIVAAVN